MLILDMYAYVYELGFVCNRFAFCSLMIFRLFIKKESISSK
jgi:hypothetical protein